MNGWTVFKLEWQLMRRDRSVAWVLLIFAMFLVLASLAGGRDVARLQTGLDMSQAEVSERLEAHRQALVTLVGSSKPMTSKDPRNVSWMGQQGAAQLATLPPAPLSFVAVGARDLSPQALRMTSRVHLIQERETETPMIGPSRLRTGAFDPAFVFVVLYPLAVIALSYQLLSSERERGTLAMLLSQPLSQTALVGGKAAARLVALCAVTLVFAVLGLLAAGADLAAPGTLTQVTLYTSVLVAWGTLWFAAAVWVNARGTSSTHNALVLVGAWLVLVVVIPGLLQVGVDTFYPAPSRIELLHEARESTQAIESELNALEGRHDINPKLGKTAQSIDAVQEKLAERAAPVLEAVSERRRERAELVEKLRFLSPAIVVQLALEDVAGTGHHRYERFEAQSEAYHRQYRAFFSERLERAVSLDLEDLEQLPAFAFEEEETTALSSRVATNLGLLAALAMMLLLAGRRGLSQIGRLTR